MIPYAVYYYTGSWDGFNRNGIYGTVPISNHLVTVMITFEAHLSFFGIRSVKLIVDIITFVFPFAPFRDDVLCMCVAFKADFMLVQQFKKKTAENGLTVITYVLFFITWAFVGVGPSCMRN